MGFDAVFSKSVNFFTGFCQGQAKSRRAGKRCFAKLVNKICTDRDGFLHKGHPQRKTGKYLLITPSFPHSPQSYPQGLSTSFLTCGNPLFPCGSVFDACRGISHFFGAVVFYHSNFLCKNIPLTSRGQKAGKCADFRQGDFPLSYLGQESGKK